MDHNLTRATARPKIDARLTSVIRYWDDLRGDRVAPARLDLQPVALSRHLSRISILERPHAGLVRIRLAGSALSTRMGMELRGMAFRSLFEARHRIAAVTAAESAITTPAITIMALSGAENSDILDGHLAILPLTDTRGGLTRAMAIYSERPATQALPQCNTTRFTVKNTWQIDIPETGPILSPVGLPGAEARAILQQVGLAAGGSGAPFEAPGKPALRVIQGGLA